MRGVAETLKSQKTSVWMYPEGTRSHKEDMLPFKKGAFHLALAGEYPIVPVVFCTYHDIYETRRLRFEGGTVKIKVLPPISTKGLASSDIDTLIEKTRSQMIQALQNISPTDATFSKME